MNQFIVPYLMSSHPGSTIKDAIALAEYLRSLKYMPEQVQDFYPTPGTVSTCMFYTGIDPLTMNEVYVERDPHKKALQRALIQYRDPKNYDLVKEALLMEGRDDLIGFDKQCLIPPRKMADRNKKNFTDKNNKGNTKNNKGRNNKNEKNKNNIKNNKVKEVRNNGKHNKNNSSSGKRRSW